MGVSEDGHPDDLTHSHSDTEPASFGQVELPNSLSKSTASTPSSIYVSIYDPTGQAFVPSKTKPLPKWMSLLPNNVHRESEEDHGDAHSGLTQQKAEVRTGVSKATFPDAYADGASSSHSEDCVGDHGLHTPCPKDEKGAELSPGSASEAATPTGKILGRKAHLVMLV